MYLTRFVYIFVIIFFTLNCFGQYDPAKTNKKAADLYSQGLTKAGEGDFTEAIRLLEGAIKIQPSFADAYLSIGGIYGEVKDYHKSVEYYQKVKSIDSI